MSSSDLAPYRYSFRANLKPLVRHGLSTTRLPITTMIERMSIIKTPSCDIVALVDLFPMAHLTL